MGGDRPKYPGVVVKLTGHSSDLHVVINRCAKAMTAYGISAAEVRQFRNEALAGDRHHVMDTCLRWVQVR